MQKSKQESKRRVVGCVLFLSAVVHNKAHCVKHSEMKHISYLELGNSKNLSFIENHLRIIVSLKYIYSLKLLKKCVLSFFSFIGFHVVLI